RDGSWVLRAWARASAEPGGNGATVRPSLGARPRSTRRDTGEVRRRTVVVLGLVALALVAAACAPNATQSALEPKGPYAQKSFDLFVPGFLVAGAVFGIVEVLV